jgi:hypothetical protein
MSKAVAEIVGFERRVMWRRRLLSLQDGLAGALTIGGIIASGLVLWVRLRPLQVPVWAVVIGALSLSAAAVAIRWFLTRANELDAAFLIDESLGLEDRVATSHLIIERGGPRRTLEEAVIEDAAGRVDDQHAGAVVPFRMRPWHALSLLSLIALAAALMFTPRTLPVTEALTAERGDLDSAAKHLERTAAEVEQVVPPDTETARLANEQGALGGEFRRSTATRADALKRLSGIEDRIRQRHDDLANTRADEIISLADRRLGGALSTLSKTQPKRIEPDESQPARTAERSAGNSNRETAKQTRTATPSDGHEPDGSSQEKARRSSLSASQHQAPTKGAQPDVAAAKPNEPGRAEPQNQPQEPVSGKNLKPDSVETDAAKSNPKVRPAAADEPGVSAEQKPIDQTTDVRKAGDENTAEQKTSDQQQNEQQKDALNALKSAPNSIAEQVAKALPKLSEELLKKAAQLRANELRPADIEKLRKAAESLSGELAQIAQSKDLQRALQEMARQIRPEQIEQVARELAGQEKLKQELESAARLLMENRQAKEMVAGLAGQLARARDEMRKQQRIENPGGPKAGGESESGSKQTSARDHASRNNQRDTVTPPGKVTAGADRSLAGQGRESSLQGKLRQGSGGEYLYLQAKSGVGAARAPYSSAYPQYRREAERSVQRTQVPLNLRSVVRRYFDAINPEAKR